jgi:hypothetical protein
MARQPQQKPGRAVFDRSIDLDSAETAIAAVQTADFLDHRHCSHDQDADQHFQMLVILVEHLDAQTLQLEVVKASEVLFMAVDSSHIG